MKILLLATMLIGCTVPEIMSTGPRISVELQGAFHTATDTDSAPFLEIDNPGPTNVTVIVDAQDGTTDNGKSETTSAVTGITATFALPGLTIPDSAFTSQRIFDSTEFTRATPISLPGSAIGKTLAVHITCVDANDLHSNVIDMSIAIQLF